MNDAAEEEQHASPVGLSTKRIEKARVLLAQAKHVEDVVGLLNEAEAMRVYTRRQDAASEAHADCWEIVQHARRTLGEICKKMPKAVAGRPKVVAATENLSPPVQISKNAALAELKISRQDASRWEKLAELPAPEFESRVKHGRERIMRDVKGDKVGSTSAASEYDGDQWGTPGDYIEAEREVFGRVLGHPVIDLDPASNADANNVVRATRFYTKEDSGLAVDWVARTVHLNQPYSAPLCAQFADHFVKQFESGRFEAGFQVVNNCTDTNWQQQLLARFWVCFPRGRIGFLHKGEPIKQNRQGQSIFYAGPEPEVFREVFSRFGHVGRPA